jgi:hypothetical protein
MTRPITSEKEIQMMCIQYIQYRGVMCWRNNTGSFVRNYYNQKEQKWKQTFFRAGQKGHADIFGVLPDGKFLAIEVKTLTGKLSKEQVEFLADVKKNNGVAVVVRSLEDIVVALAPYFHDNN